MSTFTVFVIFAGLVVGAVTRMVKIQRQELLDARAAAQAKKARLDAFRGKCHRPDGD